MSRVYLSIGAAMRNPKTERQAIIMRLQKLNYNVIGASDPKMIEMSQLRDILDMCEEKAKIPEIVTPRPRYSKKQVAEALKDMKDYQDARKAGRRRLY
jgi:uncharacterized protein YfkK (UPF0435 family)